MRKGRISSDTRRKLLLNAGGLFEALGLELTEEQRAAMEHGQTQRNKKNAKHREYYAAHKDEKRAKKREYYIAHRAKKREYYIAHRAEILAKRKARYAAHRAEILAKARKHRDEGAATFSNISPPVGEQSSIQCPAVIDQRGEVEART